MSRLEATVVIPTHDRWALLSRHGLPSALGQRDVDHEVVVVDDGSTDETPHRLAALDDPLLRVVTHETPRRLPAARNAGAGVARGRWLAFLDDDDVWAPGKLRAQLDAAEASGAEWAYGRAVVVDGRLQVLEDDPFPSPVELHRLLAGGNWIPGGGSNVVVRADAFSAAGGFDEELRFFEDWDLWLRLLERGLPAACDDVVMARVEHGGNMVVRDRDRVFEAFECVVSRRRPVTEDDRRGIAEWLALEQHRAGRRAAAARLFVTTAVRHRSPGNVAAALGALFGDRGLDLASRALVRLRGASHLEPRGRRPSEPEWLAAYR